jgi:hypothetical protein
VVAGRRHVARAKEGRDGSDDKQPLLFISLQDTGGLVEVVLFPEVYKRHTRLLANNGAGPYIVTGQVQVVGKAPGVGVQPPAGLWPSDALALKTHPVLIAESVEPIG